MEPKVFAPSYPRDEDGLIRFPDDSRTRTARMPLKVDHPSHNNIFMYEEIIKFLSEPGDVVCDPMMGAGTALMTTPSDRWLYGVELGPYFHDLLVRNAEILRPDSLTVIKLGDCVEELPKIEAEMGGKARLVVFSPPYADQIQMSKGHAIYDKREQGEGTAGIRNYAYDDRRNLGNMKQFQFNRAMRQVYKACWDALLPGGYICVVIKDRIDKGRKVGYGVHHAGLMMKQGFGLYQWHKRYAVGHVFGYWNMQQGIRQITDEHIIMMQKKGE